MEKKEIRWNTLESTVDNNSLKQHGFIEKASGNNISLCGKIVHYDCNKLDEKSFVHIVDEGMNDNCCKNCKKSITTAHNRA